MEFNKTLLANNIKYNFERFILHKSSVSANQRQVFLSQIFGSLIPNKLHIMIVDQTACIGDATRNAQYFDHFNLDDINIIANGLSVLNTEVSFTNKYSGLYKRVTEAMKTKDHSISYKNFAAGATIITVDCQNSETNNLLQIEKRGHLEIHLRFSAALPRPINIIILGSTVGSIEIDSDRRVLTHYNF